MLNTVKQGSLSMSLFEPRQAGVNKPGNDAIFNGLGSTGSSSRASLKTPRQTASDRKWEGVAWISPEQLACNVNKRPRKGHPSPCDEEEVPVVSAVTATKPRPPDPVNDKDMDSRKRDKDRIPSEQTWNWDVATEDWVLGPRPRVMEVGMFFSYSPIPNKQIVLLQWLIAEKDTSALNADFLRKHLIPRLNRTHQVSLRLLDWLVVDYAREKSVAYRRYFPHIKQYRLVVVYALYFEWLTRWRRRHFDVFRRRHRIYFNLDGQTYSTTVAQLHFFYMAELYGFLDYAQEHAKEIEEHMQMKLGITNEIKKQAAEKGEQYKRRPLVEKCPPKAYISEAECVLTFKIDETSEEEEEDGDDE